MITVDFQLLLRIVPVLLILGIAGCGKKSPDYTPSFDTAVDALRHGLERWKAGDPPGEVPGTHPLVHVTDGGRKPGQTLKSFQILGEARGVSGRTIAVTLQLENPAEEVKARYIVIGIDPLLIFRQEDFDLLMHWDHHMPATKVTESDPSAANATSDEANPSQTQAPATPEPGETQK